MFSDFHKCAVLNKHVHTKNKYNLFKAKNKVKIQIKQILYVLKIVHTLIYKYITGVNFNIIVILILRISYVYTMCSYHIHPPGLLNFVSSFFVPIGSTLFYPYATKCGTIEWSMVGLPGVISLKKNVFPTPRS